jgi:hypothetical protein
VIEKKQIAEQRKKLSDQDLQALSEILSNVTVTQSGMLRIMAFLVPNPDFAKCLDEINTSLKRIGKKLDMLEEQVPSVKM